ncbi:ATP-binding cassette domain-containing protein [Streptomyces sp. NPDC001492]
MGRSGAGKSLPAALAGRLVHPDRGEVLLDGVPLRRLRRDELRRAVAYAFEHPVLLGETFADAIGSGARATCDEEPTARADAFIPHMPAGQASRVAEPPVSGGEAQRNGPARAFHPSRRVPVLEDAAASLDTVTEHHLSQVLTGALAERTRLVVTHRACAAAPRALARGRRGALGGCDALSGSGRPARSTRPGRCPCSKTPRQAWTP